MMTTRRSRQVAASFAAGLSHSHHSGNQRYSDRFVPISRQADSPNPLPAQQFEKADHPQPRIRSDAEPPFAIVLNVLAELLNRSVLLFDLSLPYMWVDVTDKHLTSLLSSFSSLLALSSLYRHRPAMSPPSLAVSTRSPPPPYLFIGYCRIHPIYFLLSIELNTFVSLSFQRTPLRFRVHPLTQATGRIEDFLRQIVNGLLPSVLLQSPSFVGALDLIGNPANLVISLYNSIVNVVRNPLSAVPIPHRFDRSSAAAKESSQRSSRTLLLRSPSYRRSSAARSRASRRSAAV